MTETGNVLEKLAKLETEANIYREARDNAQNALDSTEQEIVDVLGELVANSPENPEIVTD